MTEVCGRQKKAWGVFGLLKKETNITRLLAEKGVGVELKKSGVKAILESSFDQSYGARPVERFLEGEVVTALSRLLISGELTSGTIVHIEGRNTESEDGPITKKSRKGELHYRLEPDSSNKNGQEYENQQSVESMPTQ